MEQTRLCCNAAPMHVAIIANGELEIENRAFIQKLRLFKKYIFADGGLNYAPELNVTPDIVVGDLDSVKPELLKKYPNARIIKFDRAKDHTDIEEALKHIKVNDIAHVYGGLGGRIDHSLANIFLLLRYPGRMFLETAHEKLFALNDKTVDFKLECLPHQVLTFIPIYGSAEGIHVQGDKQNYQFSILNNEKNSYTTGPLGKKFKVSVAKGEVICILGEPRPQETELPKAGTIRTNFKISQPFTETLKILRQLCRFPYRLRVETDEEIVFAINRNLGQWTLPKEDQAKVIKGTTVSLVPFNGPSTLVANGLKWQGKIDFSKYFVGVSNIAMTPQFSIKVESGNALCIVNKNLIDQEMIGLKDKTSTAAYDSADN